MNRKFVTEFCLSYMNSFTTMISAQELLSNGELTPEQSEMVSRCNIYIIAARPMPYFKPETIKHENNQLSGVLAWRVDGKENQMEFNNYKWILEDDAIKIDCQYPNREIISRNEIGSEVTRVSSSFLASYFSKKLFDSCHELNDYEVLYIGQALGKQGNRTAYERLKSHSTLQKILAQVGYKYPDKEIMIYMYEFNNAQMYTSIDGRAENADNSPKNEARLIHAIKNPPSKSQKIGLIEAGLIRYFQPEYNEHFKIAFPSTKHRVLQSCRNLDVTGLAIEIDCTDMIYSLYSPTVRTNDHHLAQIDLVSESERLSFFFPTGFTNNPEVIK
ncbi:TPA: hypothetical protein ACVBYD_002974 [Yersinia enterocolitica]|nr:hypothetical protein [Yersinia enterocolitica]HDL7370770.1 hypothetical protein [Yersinia enterocolitica]HDL8153597.1 hypothetical protein [Yersinia enterocolitica]HDR0560739.1 hypothetical protein [Yersinia enterocolitica]HEF7278904.1 hypothetical protein [Yersinia enterocolitica]